MKPMYLVFAALLLSSPAYSQSTGGAAAGAAGGAAVGAAIVGAPGAAVGGAIGAITGSLLPTRPSVTYSGPVVVGEMLPDTVAVYPVPEYDAYSYTVIGPRRVIVERKTHRIVRIID
jgi:Protein of unknown function (DUF1236)